MKKLISTVLIGTIALPPVSGDIMHKIRGYSIQLNGKSLDVVNRNLWFSSASSDIEEYASAIKNSPHNPISSNAVMVYSKIGADDQTITLNNGQVVDLINSAPEYYFTDMVFIQQKYEEALIDLYYYRAELSGSSRSTENRAIMDEAIGGTYWIAQQNGQTIDPAEIEAKFMESLNEKLQVIEAKFVTDYGDVSNDAEVNIKKLTGALSNYYLDPNIETFEGIIKTAQECEQDLDTIAVDWIVLLGIMLTDICMGLYIALRNHYKNNLTMTTPVQISPVEVGEKEATLVFGGNR